MVYDHSLDICKHILALAVATLFHLAFLDIRHATTAFDQVIAGTMILFVFVLLLLVKHHFILSSMLLLIMLLGHHFCHAMLAM